MSKIKIAFILMGLVTMLYAVAWHIKTGTLRDEASNYVHNEIFKSTRIIDQIGAISPGNEFRIDTESRGSRYIFRIYEEVSKDASVVVTVSKFEGKWELVSFIYTKDGKSKVLVDYGKDMP